MRKTNPNVARPLLLFNATKLSLFGVLKTQKAKKPNSRIKHFLSTRFHFAPFFIIFIFILKGIDFSGNRSVSVSILFNRLFQFQQFQTSKQSSPLKPQFQLDYHLSFPSLPIYILQTITELNGTHTKTPKRILFIKIRFTFKTRIHLLIYFNSLLMIIEVNAFLLRL